MKRASLCGMLVFLLLFAVSATAQETAGAIEGVVRDTSGAVLPGVAVEARNPQGAVVSVTSDQTGQYRFNALAPGARCIGRREIDAGHPASNVDTQDPMRSGR